MLTFQHISTKRASDMKLVDILKEYFPRLKENTMKTLEHYRYILRKRNYLIVYKVYEETVEQSANIYSY